MLPIDRIYRKKFNDDDDVDCIINTFYKLFDENAEIFKKKFIAEIKTYKKMNIEGSLENIISSTQSMFQILPQLFIILAVCPPSVASAERSFSCLRRLKTWLRTTMAQDRLQGLASINLSMDNPSVGDVFDRFALKSRKHEILL